MYRRLFTPRHRARALGQLAFVVGHVHCVPQSFATSAARGPLLLDTLSHMAAVRAEWPQLASNRCDEFFDREPVMCPKATVRRQSKATVGGGGRGS